MEKRIILGEENGSLRNRIKQALEDSGYITVACPTGKMAYQFGRSNAFDAMIINVSLEHREYGMPVVEQCTCNSLFEIPIVAYGGSEALARSSANGCDGLHVIEYPFEEDALITLIKGLVGESTANPLSTSTP